MSLLLCTILVTVAEGAEFFHVTDFHLDNYYNHSRRTLNQVCPSSYGTDALDPGPWGDYNCDSPWQLINSSVYAMKNINEAPSFIVWTGDSNLHAKDLYPYLNETLVVEDIKRITDLIKDVFPGVKVFPTIGNHDVYPENEIPADGSVILQGLAEIWKNWFSDESYKTFKKHGYYFEAIDDNNIIICLNTMLWYAKNKLVDGSVAVAGQFDWFEGILADASINGQKVYITAHAGPGYHEELKDEKYLYEQCNVRYNELIVKYHDVIMGQMFAHLHSDTFRIFKNDTGEVVSSLLFGPSVSPNWKYNPSFRLFQYETDTLLLKDFKQYFFNLTKANDELYEDADASLWWELEYSAIDAYGLKDLSAGELDSLVGEFYDAMKTESATTSKLKYEKYLMHQHASYGVVTDMCGDDEDVCNRNQYCAITEVDSEKHKKCIDSWNGAQHRLANLTNFLIPAVLLLWLCG